MNLIYPWLHDYENFHAKSALSGERIEGRGT